MTPLLSKSAAAWPWAASLASGVLLIGCYPPWNQGWLIWVALVPLLAALWHPIPRPGVEAGRWQRAWWQLRPVALGWLAGLVFYTGTFYWLRELAVVFGSPVLVGVPALLGAYLAGYMGLWSWFATRLLPRPAEKFDSSWRNLLYGFVGASAWVGLDWIRSILFSGFGWNSLGVAVRQDLAMIQIADLTGTFGLSWLVAFVNIMVVVILRRLRHDFGPFFLSRIRWEFSATMLVVAAAFAYGAHALMKTHHGIPTVFKVAVLQPNVEESVKRSDDAEGVQKMLLDLDQLCDEAAKHDPQLMIWPESAIPGGAGSADAFLNRQMGRGPFSLLAGALEEEPSTTHAGEFDTYNSALLFTASGRKMAAYRKMHLVPWGEYLPLRRWMPSILEALIPGDLAAGSKPSVLTMEEPAVPLGVLICFEDTLGDQTRGFVKNGARLLVNITNDGWFRESPGSEQHLANATLRAVEMRRPLLRCTNSGVTCLVDPDGRVSQPWIKPFTQGTETRYITLQADAPLTFYARYGDWCAWLSAGVAVAWVALRVRQRREVRG